MTNIHIYEGSSKRLDHYLTEEFDFTRSFFHHIIKRGGITVNGNTVKKSYKMQDGDKVEIDDLQRYLEPNLLADAPEIEIPVVYETENMLVLNKPKGVLSHPNSIRDVQNPSVVSFLYHKYKELPSIGSFIRAGLVHRLDKETDGLMIVAKTEKGLAHFKSLFNRKSEAPYIDDKEKIPLRKFYVAKCQITDQGRKFIDMMTKEKFPHYIIEDVMPKTPRPIAKMGITKVLSVEEAGDIATINVEILTGRTHQIRVHLSNHGLPVVGDYIYGKDDGTPMGLSAVRLEFEDENGEMKVVVL